MKQIEGRKFRRTITSSKVAGQAGGGDPPFAGEKGFRGPQAAAVPLLDHVWSCGVAGALFYRTARQMRALSNPGAPAAVTDGKQCYGSRSRWKSVNDNPSGLRGTGIEKKFSSIQVCATEQESLSSSTTHLLPGPAPA
ncbi:hypothetical protein ANO11243_062880 [Dothideomycetidae sp. 11243]|nr:hypothetical protein ANO11243_062880 [fungal sp. No.11243]